MSCENGTNDDVAPLSETTVEGIHSAAAFYRQSSSSIKSEHTSTVLVIYTGGTIGMVSKDGAYQPLANCMISKLQTLSIFNSADFQPSSSSKEDKENYLMLQMDLPNEQVLRPSTVRNKRIAYKIIEFDPLLDSSNMAISDWIKIAECIKANYEEFDGFVVLHGTDTMAYTASALSFMLENLGKPVILTGSQIPIYETRSDGRDNFLGSLIIAGNYSIPEVMVCFNEKVFRGNRCIKADADSFSAFNSPNMPPLVKLQVDIKVDYNSIYRSSSKEKFTISTSMCPNVGLLRLFPGITIQTVRAFLQPPVQGVVLQTYGAGNAPNNRPDLLALFKEAFNWGVIIVNISQCTKGNVGTAYATGMALREAGVILGGDMTPEAALTKLAYVLGKDSWNLDFKRKMMARNLRGELTSVSQPDLAITDSDLIDSVARYMCLSTREEIVKVKDAIYPCLMCAAAKANDIPAIEKLRVAGGHLGAVNQDGRTALHIACREGHINMVHYLLNHGVSVHDRDSHKKTCLYEAVLGRHLEIIRLLVQTGALLSLSPIELAVKMCCAAAENDVEGIEAWILAGVDPNCQDYDKRTPLHVAVTLECIDVSKFLVAHGAKSDMKDVFGLTPYSIALSLNQTEVLNVMSALQENP
ncbi:L-asparaginase [Plakobranchus ocellatus]|uniref:asparaginase n=1 Tax=Plakobranchus ocellatus TaxID=259542 RepID=A0AAV4E3X4_9GAST|nr:L-asparaginase [Plakobranchus ocellatus]